MSLGGRDARGAGAGAPARAPRRPPAPPPPRPHNPIQPIYDEADPRSRSKDTPPMPEFSYTDLLPLGPDTTQYRPVSAGGVTVRSAFGREFIEIEPAALTELTAAA